MAWIAGWISRAILPSNEGLRVEERGEGRSIQGSDIYKSSSFSLVLQFPLEFWLGVFALQTGGGPIGEGTPQRSCRCFKTSTRENGKNDGRQLSGQNCGFSSVSCLSLLCQTPKAFSSLAMYSYLLSLLRKFVPRDSYLPVYLFVVGIVFSCGLAITTVDLLVRSSVAVQPAS